jgi:hypothetical protein
VKRPRDQRDTPPPFVPIQTSPAASSASARTPLLPRPGVVAAVKTTKRIPSNRASPSWVPTQR